MVKPIIYSTVTCPYCKMAKAYLAEKGITYDERDVTNDEALQQEMVKKSGQLAVPVIDIGGTIIVGFDRPAINQALGLS